MAAHGRWTLPTPAPLELAPFLRGAGSQQQGMKKSWTLSSPTTLAVVGLFILLLIALSFSALPSYSSNSALFDWFSTANTSTVEFDYEDYDQSVSPHRPQVEEEEQDSETLLGDVNVTAKENEEQIIPAVPSSATTNNNNSDVNFTSTNTVTQEDRLTDNSSVTSLSSDGLRERIREQEESSTQSCDFYTGSWVRDETYPLFQPFECPFVDTAFQCQENGRKDSDYLHWRWQPSGCELPRFDAKDMLRRLRRKRVVFVGDSIGRNQWVSLVCMLYQGVSNRSNVYEARSQRVSKTRPSFSVRFVDYKVQVDYYRSHYLVPESRRPPGASKKIRCTLSLDRVDKSVSKSKDADVVVFNSGHWWNHNKVRRGRCYFVEKDNFTTSMDVLTAYEKSLRAWASWVDSHAVKHVFFRGLAPSHFSGGDWDTGGSCDMHKRPLEDEAKLDEYPSKVKIQEDVLKSMKTRVTFLNVTKLSLYRKDGHVGGWGKPHGNGRQDCSHWCLPGVPDSWNHLFYVSLIQRL